MLRHGLAAAAILAAMVPAAASAEGEYLVQVKPGPKRYFHLDNKERAGCPANTVACRRTAYVLAGDQLVALGRVRGYTRVTSVPAGGNRPTSGWIETKALRTVSLPSPAASDWLGEWRAFDNGIFIRPAKAAGRYRIEGAARWGAQDLELVAKGRVHVAEFGVTVAFTGDRIAFASIWGADDPEDHPALPYDTTGACQVSLRLLGPYLLAENVRDCGGANASFTGVYRR